VGKGFKRGVLFGPLNRRSQPHRCIACQRPIIYGDRCQDCRNKLRQRKRRKPR
jgi:hypothetical protein